MAEIGLAVGGWFVSAIISKIIDVGYTHFRGKLDMKEKLDRINDRILQINSVLDLVDKVDLASSTNRELKTWFWKIKNVVKSMDAIIDELEYLRIENLVMKGKVRRKLLFPFKFVAQTLPMSNKLKAVITNLDKLVAEDIDRFCNVVDRNMTQQDHSGRGGLINKKENYFFGRQENKDELINWLLGPDVLVQAIVGHGGLGKTALAKHVSDDDRVKEHFGNRIWWVVLPIGFNCNLLITCIHEAMFGNKHQTQDQNRMEMDIIREASSGKFLLVFDDVWNDENLDIWDAIFHLLKSEESGSKIIVTTRLNSVATKVMDSIDPPPFTLKELEDNHIWTLLCHYANVYHEKPEFMRFREIIVKNLKGSPLAAIMLGGMLKGGDCQKWDGIMNKLNDRHLDENIMPTLKLSYEQLPLHLRPLFRYFSIFSPHERFLKKQVVGMWMGAGLLQPKNGETLEDIGYRCFDVLLQKSFIEVLEGEDEDGLEPFYRMHDLLHNLAEHVSEGEIHRYSDDIVRSHEIPGTTRHLSIDTKNTNVFEKVGKLDHLCSLRMTVSHSVFQSCSDADLKSLFSKTITRSIRVFDIGKYGESPRSKLLPHIKKMKYLRYIDISRQWKEIEIDIASLFQAFQKLYLLENLIIDCHLFKPLKFHFCKKFDLDIMHDPVARLEDEELWLLLCKTARSSPENSELQGLRNYMPKLRGSSWLANMYGNSIRFTGIEVVERIMNHLDTRRSYLPFKGPQRLRFEQL